MKEGTLKGRENILGGGSGTLKKSYARGGIRGWGVRV